MFISRFNNRTDCDALVHHERSKTNEWTRILMSSKNINDKQRDNPCTVSRTYGRKQLQILKQKWRIQPEVSRSSLG